MARQTSKATVARARAFRRKMSLPEVLLWNELRGGVAGVSFRRQHPVGAYVVDFYCAAAKLAIEIDGIAHDMGARAERDAIRDAKLRGMGIETMRVPASEVLKSPLDVADAIAALCRARRA